MGGLSEGRRGDPTRSVFSQRDSAGRRGDIRLQNQRHLDEGSKLSSLREAESILQTLVIGGGDSEAFSALKSESDNEHIVHSNYRSSHDTLDKLEEDGSEHTLTP